MNKKKFNSHKFRVCVDKKIRENGFTGVEGFTKANGFPRNALARAMAGISRPTPESLNKWCTALNCTSEERTEIYHAAGWFTPEELEEQESDEPENVAA